jgi:hypothetical protein
MTAASISILVACGVGALLIVIGIAITIYELPSKKDVVRPYKNWEFLEETAYSLGPLRFTAHTYSSGLPLIGIGAILLLASLILAKFSN